MSGPAAGDVWVRDVGLCTPLGGLHQACAAFRAGITRTAELPDQPLPFLEPEDDAPPAPVVHAVQGVTDGFSGTGRLVALLTEALLDLGSRVDLRTVLPAAAVWLVVPERSSANGDEAVADAPEAAKAVLMRAAQIADLPVTASAIRAFAGDATALADALGAAREELTVRRVSAVVLCVVDSLASPESVEALLRENQLKTPELAVGLMPGEAAAAILLAPIREASSAVQAVFVGQVHTAAVPGREAPSDGRALTDCVRSALGDVKAPYVLVSDHDGRAPRAHELGMLLHRLGPQRQPVETVLPATGFGATGVATGALAIAVALRAVARKYAKAPHFIAVLSGENGRRAAVRLYAG